MADSTSDQDAVDVDRVYASITPGTMRDAVHMRAISAARTELEAAERRLVAAVWEARRAGDSWTIIGVALRTSKQAAHRKFAPLIEELARTASMSSGTDRLVDEEVDALRQMIERRLTSDSPDEEAFR